MVVSNVAAKLGLWLWYLLPANPILVRVVSGASRRPRHFWLRLGYLSALLLVVLVSLLNAMTGQNASLAELAKEASRTFTLASTAQLALMCFLAPVFTASAITQERDAQTFNILLSTPLSSAQIVFGSLISRLYFVIMLLLAGLPIFLMTMVYGGVTASQVVESFALSGSTAVLTGALAIFTAMIGVGTRRTIFSFYLLIAIYLLCLYMLGRWDVTWVEQSAANLAGQKMSWLTPVHPFLALDVALNRVYAPPYGRLGHHSAIIRYALAYPSVVYVIWTLCLAFLLTTASVLFVRRGAKVGESTFFSRLAERLGRPGSGEIRRKPRTVWKNPVAWREAKTKTSSGGLLRLAITIGGFVGPLILFIAYVQDPKKLTPQVGDWLSALVIIQFALGLLIATNTAATSITKEKESLSMDILLTTPLTSKYILWGKLRGLVTFTLPLLLGPVVVVFLFGLHGVFRGTRPPIVQLETAVELGAMLVVYTAFACIIGLWRSLNSKTNVSSVMYSIGVLIALSGIASLIGFSLVQASGPQFGAFLAPFTPFTSIAKMVNPASLFSSRSDYAAGVDTSRMAGLMGSVVAAALYAFIAWRLYIGLVRNFDMTLRKQSAS